MDFPLEGADYDTEAEWRPKVPEISTPWRPDMPQFSRSKTVQDIGKVILASLVLLLT